MQEQRPHRSYLASILSCRCPRCREGKLFKYPLTLRLKRFMQMNQRCSVCGQATDIEVGFYYGTSYVSYLLAIGTSAITFILWWIIIGFSLSDNRFFYWMGFNAFLLISMQPWLMRFSRSLWISWFVKYDPQWQEKQPDFYERINKDQMDNW